MIVLHYHPLLLRALPNLCITSREPIKRARAIKGVVEQSFEFAFLFLLFYREEDPLSSSVVNP